MSDELRQKAANRSQPDDDLRDLGDNQIEDLSNDQVDSAQGTLVETRPKDIKPTEYVWQTKQVFETPYICCWRFG